MTHTQEVEKHLNWIKTGEKMTKKGKARTIYRRICKFCGHNKQTIRTGLQGQAVYRCQRCKREVEYK